MKFNINYEINDSEIEDSVRKIMKEPPEDYDEDECDEFEIGFIDSEVDNYFSDFRYTMKNYFLNSIKDSITCILLEKISKRFMNGNFTFKTLFDYIKKLDNNYYTYNTSNNEFEIIFDKNKNECIITRNERCEIEIHQDLEDNSIIVEYKYYQESAYSYISKEYKYFKENHTFLKSLYSINSRELNYYLIDILKILNEIIDGKISGFIIREQKNE